MFDFLKKDILHVQLQNLPKWKAWWIKFLRIMVLTSKGFTKGQIQHGASSLTYYTLLTIVPIVALLIGIARGFSLEKTFELWLLKQFSEQAFVIKKLFEFADTSLKQAQGGIIAGIGVALFLWAAIKILLNIESVIDQIWEVKKGRTYAKRAADYIAMIFLAPIIILAASGLTAFLSAALSTLSQGDPFLEKITPALIPLLNIIPFILICLLFTFLYIFMPSTRVKFLPALFAGIFTSVVYQLVQWVYLYFQIGVAKYNAIYGTFAALPLFLIWLHLSWTIVLLGAKLSFAIQNIDAYGLVSEDMKLNKKFVTVSSLRIVHFCIQKFCSSSPPPTKTEISNSLTLPYLLTSHLIYQLVESDILTEMKREKDKENSYQPARSVDKLTIKGVIDMIDTKGEALPLPSSPEITLILKSLEKFNTAIENSEGNILLKNI